MLKHVIQSIKFYRNQQIATILATATCTAILTGAFIIGDSVRGSLSEMVSERLGNTSYVLELNHRYIKSSLADKLAKQIGTKVSPVLRTNAILSKSGGELVVSNVRINGIDSRFTHFANQADLFDKLSDDEIIINKPLAQHLNLRVGDEVILRFNDSGFLPSDTPIAGNIKNMNAARYKISSIIGQKELGNFNLRINQVAPENVFMSLTALSRTLNLDNHVNTLLISGNDSKAINMQSIDSALNSIWEITDGGFDLVFLSNQKIWELRSKNIFIDSSITQLIIDSGKIFKPVLTYFVNGISKASKTSPYSFVSATGAPVVPASMSDSEIIVNQWLADDLNLRRNDSLRMAYFVPSSNNTLMEESRMFKIHSIVPLRGIYADRDLMPGFPGLSDVDNCRNWEPGIPIDLELIRDKDETYWEQYRGIPKTFVTLTAAREMWQNRFGDCTSIRINSENIEQVKNNLSQIITPKQLGITFTNIKQNANIAVNQSVDFSELFFGLSFFMILSALVLISLIYKLNIENRIRETGLYFALGFRPAVILRIMLYEGTMISLISSIFGIILSVIYTWLVLYGLNSVWQGAIGTTSISMHITVSSLLSGFLISIVIVVLTIILSLIRFARADAGTLQRALPKILSNKRKSRTYFSLLIGIICILASLVLIFSTDAGRSREAASTFFICGFLMLSGGLAFLNYLLQKNTTIKIFSPFNRFAIQNSTRNRLRSLLLVGVLASSLFIVFTVGANRSSQVEDMSIRKSGTGGFVLFGETVFPINTDLNSPDGKKLLDITDSIYQDDRFVQFRLREGDDASCLNLNRTSQPKILGVNPDQLAQRKAFGFNALIPQINSSDPWQALDAVYEDDVIPGIADETVIIWGLGKSVGDTITYLDESGRFLKVKLIAGLANSIFQGHLIISEKNLLKYFPSVSGYRLFLVDTDSQHLEKLQNKLSWNLQDYGFQMQTTAQRLAAFSKVENTYLSIFLILGGFAIILGTIGMGLIVYKNVLERKTELAVMRSVGFTTSAVKRLIFIEHSWLLLLGILLGLISAIISVMPALLSPNANIPLVTIFAILITILISGLIWTYLATNQALKSDVISALRYE
jgi:putative ABC transport system permease protein